MAYWINAYNALTIKGVVDAYPLKSVKDIKILSGFFNRTWHTVGGESYTLNSIEHDIIRAKFGDLAYTRPSTAPRAGTQG